MLLRFPLRHKNIVRGMQGRNSNTVYIRNLQLFSLSRHDLKKSFSWGPVLRFKPTQGHLNCFELYEFYSLQKTYNKSRIFKNYGYESLHGDFQLNFDESNFVEILNWIQNLFTPERTLQINTGNTLVASFNVLNQKKNTQKITRRRGEAGDAVCKSGREFRFLPR